MALKRPEEPFTSTLTSKTNLQVIVTTQDSDAFSCHWLAVLYKPMRIKNPLRRPSGLKSYDQVKLISFTTN